MAASLEDVGSAHPTFYLDVAISPGLCSGFDGVFDGGVSQLSDTNPKKLKVSLIAADGTKLLIDGKEPEILLQAAKGTATAYSDDRWRIGYGETGFETFTIDVPDALRGKVATLRFELSGGEVYVDNVFFKSQHLLLGNPSEARKPGTVGSSSDRKPYDTNYLLEMPQYAVSYNDATKIPNWVSWQMNPALADKTVRRQDNFSQNNDLPRAISF